MPAPDWEDLSVFFDTDEFAATVTVKPRNGLGYDIRAIYDNPEEQATAGEYQLDTRTPRLVCISLDVKNVRRGDAVEIDGQSFDVLDTPHHDGTGIATVELGMPE